MHSNSSISTSAHTHTHKSTHVHAHCCTYFPHICWGQKFTRRLHFNKVCAHTQMHWYKSSLMCINNKPSSLVHVLDGPTHHFSHTHIILRQHLYMKPTFDITYFYTKSKFIYCRKPSIDMIIYHTIEFHSWCFLASVRSKSICLDHIVNCKVDKWSI